MTSMNIQQLNIFDSNSDDSDTQSESDSINPFDSDDSNESITCDREQEFREREQKLREQHQREDHLCAQGPNRYTLSKYATVIKKDSWWKVGDQTINKVRSTRSPSRSTRSPSMSPLHTICRNNEDLIHDDRTDIERLQGQVDVANIYPEHLDIVVVIPRIFGWSEAAKAAFTCQGRPAKIAEQSKLRNGTIIMSGDFIIIWRHITKDIFEHFVKTKGFTADLNQVDPNVLIYECTGKIPKKN